MRSILLTLTVFLSFSLTAFAQIQGFEESSFEPMDSWPYLYYNFENGRVRTAKGALLDYNSLNVNIVDGSLHFIKAGTIMKADMTQMYTALIGDTDVYVNAGGKMYQILLESEHGYVLCGTSVDMDELNKVDIGYGVSSSTASRTNTSFAGLGMDNISGINMSNMTLTRAEQQRSAGMLLPVKKTTYLLVNDYLIPAGRRDIEQFVDKKAVKAFFKENKINWKKPETMEPLLVFLEEHLK